MTETQNGQPAVDQPAKGSVSSEETALQYYKIRFRKQGQEFTASSHMADLKRDDKVMVKTDQGPEPAFIVARSFGLIYISMDCPASFRIQRRASNEEQERFLALPTLEHDAFQLCRRQIEKLNLPMHLVRVERFFNGSKIIFYFTAESRVDFRELVKVLVQEFRTRVEMRQIGVRHETQMTGGLGACGRELCCSSFLTKFDSVSIKMAKTQDLPLNPSKISGVCNRLLCCLTYEYETYRSMKKGMPRVGRSIQIEGKAFQVIRQIPLTGKVAAVSEKGEERLFSEDEWRAADQIPKSNVRKGPGKKGGKAGSIDIWGMGDLDAIPED